MNWCCSHLPPLLHNAYWFVYCLGKLVHVIKAHYLFVCLHYIMYVMNVFKGLFYATHDSCKQGRDRKSVV